MARSSVALLSFSRRSLLRAAAIGSAAGASALLAACGAPASPTAAPAKPTEAPKPAAEPTKPVAAAPTTAPAAAPTTAPTAVAKPAEPTKPAAAATTAPAAKPAAATGPVTLQFWHQSPEHLANYQRLMAEFKTKQPNITINVTMTAGDQYHAKLQAALNAGSGPDIFSAPGRPALDEFVKTGFLHDLTKDVNTTELLPLARDAGVSGGKTWVVPAGAYTVGIVYHQDLFEKGGITKEPTTWGEMRAVMEQLKGKGMVPYSIGGQDGTLPFFNYIGLASAVLGTDGFEAVQTGKKKLNEPDLVAVVQELRDWEPYYQPNFRGSAYLESKQLFATQKTVMMDAGSGDIPGFYELKPDVKLGFFYFPAPNEQKKPATNTGMAGTYGVNSKGANREAGIAWIQWISTVEGNQVTHQLLKFVPTVKGVKPAGDPVVTKMMATPLDIPVWYERFPTANVGTVWSKESISAFDKNKTAQEFADKLQKSVDEQLAKQK